MATKRIRVVVAALEKFIDRSIRILVLDIVANLRSSPDSGYGTPVDTGWARANWIPNIGARFEGTAGTKRAAEAGMVTTAIQEQGIASVATRYSTRQGRVYISNNVPYILRLNEGSSRQAPKGFVQNAIIKAIREDLPAKLALLGGNR